MEHIHSLTKIDKWFLYKLKVSVTVIRTLNGCFAEKRR